MAADFLAGCLGGCAGVAIGHPLDTVKVKIQTQDFRNPQYRGTLDCFAQTVRNESVRGLYKGMSSPMAGAAMVNAIIFGVHGNIIKRVNDPNALSSQFMAGASAGFVQAFVCSPMELVKTRVQLQAENADPASNNKSGSKYKSPFHCFQEIYRTEGIPGIFRGQLITITREIPALGTYFMSYEWFTRLMSGQSGMESSVGTILMAGGLAGAMSWIFTYPIDVIKSRIQIDGAFGPAKYKGIFDCAMKSVKEEGYSVLTRGLNTTIFRSFPTNAATFAVASWTLRLCHQAEQLDIPTWKEIIKSGEIILTAARIPQEIHFHNQLAFPVIMPNKLMKVRFLPIVLAESNDMDTDIQNESNISDEANFAMTKDVRLSSIKENCSKDRCNAGIWKRTGNIFTYTRDSISSLTVSQQILSLNI